MPKFTKPFDDYEVCEKQPPIEIQLSRNKILSFEHFFDNPIYYYNGFQYISGGLYRAILGFERIWDVEFEKELTDSLDDYLHSCKMEREYFFEDLVFTKDRTIWGIPWRQGVKPKVKFTGFKQTALIAFEAGTRILARYNCLDAPFHVDVENVETGQVYTISYQRFLNQKPLCLEKYANPTQSSKGELSKKDGSKNPPRNTGTAVHELHPQEVVVQLSRLRKRFRRTNQM